MPSQKKKTDKTDPRLIFRLEPELEAATLRYGKSLGLGKSSVMRMALHRLLFHEGYLNEDGTLPDNDAQQYAAAKLNESPPKYGKKKP